MIDQMMYSAMSICPLPSSSRALKRSLSSLSEISPASRSRTKTQNSSKSSLPSLSASAASRSAAFWRMPVSKSSSPVPATSSVPGSPAPPAWASDGLEGEFESGFPASAAFLARSAFFRASAMPLSLSAYLNSWNSMKPVLSTSIDSNSSSIANFGASYPRAATAARSSFLSSAPLPSSSHSRNRSISRTLFSLRILRSCSGILSPVRLVSFTIGGSIAACAET